MNEFLILFLTGIFSLKVEKVSKFGSPPPPQINPSTSYSAETNQILVFGGETLGNSVYSSSLYLFDLNNSTWEELVPSSSFTPEGLILSRSFMEDQNNLLVFFGRTTKGISSYIYRFDLAKSLWSTVTFFGDQIVSSIRGGHCLFEHNSTKFFAIFGGITSNGKSEDLHLIDVQGLTVRLMKNQGESPGKQAYGSLAYYENSLYYFGLNEEDSSALFYKYNLNDETWTRIKSEPAEITGRNEHASFIYENKLYIYFGYTYYDAINFWQAYNLITSEWETNKDYIESIKDFSFLFINSELYIICGSNENGYKNAIFSYSPGSSTKKVVIPNSSMPNKRGYHASFVYGNCIYIFGGSFEGQYFNDMWKFDVLNGEWTELKMEGSIPAPRDRMLSIDLKGNGLWITGGRSENTVFDDIYKFSPEQLTWTIMPVYDSMKISRYNGCIILNGLNSFIIGGQDFSRSYNSIWLYEYSNNKTYDLSANSNLPIEIINHNCWFSVINSERILFIFGGTDYYKTPNNKTYKIQLPDLSSEDYSYKILKTLQDQHVTLTSPTSIVSGDQVFIIGGLILGERVNEHLYVFDLKKEKFYKSSYLGNLNLIGHSSSQVGDNIFVFGGLLTKDSYQVSSTGTNGLYKLTFESTDVYKPACLGGDTTSGSCQPCSKGTYNLNGKCTKCPAGTYSNNIGGQDASECYPCKAGEFNDKEGASYCKTCPSSKYCPTGSKSYIDTNEVLYASDGNSDEYIENSDLVEYIVKISSLSLFGLFFVFLVWIIWFDEFRKYFERYDMFVNSHEQQLNAPVYYKKTSLGGLFSIIFVLLAISTFSTSLLSFLIDNITQSQTLIPSIAYSGNIKADYIEFNIKYYIFGGVCNSANKCPKDTLITDYGFNFKHKTVTCVKEETDCIIKIQYTEFETEKKSTLRIKMGELTAYCSIISVNISVSSSIPDQFSKIFIPLYPPSFNESFKGNGVNKFKIEFISSVRTIQVFYSESSKWTSKDTGYHLQNLNSHEIGSTADYLSINSVAGLIIEVQVQASDSILVTKRNLKYSTSLFFGTLLGSIFGLSGTVGLFLHFAELAENIFLKRKALKEKTVNIKQQREAISMNFSYKRIEELLEFRKISFTMD